MGNIGVEPDYSMLVNKANYLEADYVPSGLIPVHSRIKPFINPNHELLLLPMVIISFRELQDAAWRNKFDLEISSGYRSFEYQQQIMNAYLVKNGANAYDTVALPGRSEHQTGLAIDYMLYRKTKRGDMNTSEIEKFEQRKKVANLWVADNAYKYGFVLRYPEKKQHITGFAAEPWHLRYVGEDVAGKLHKTGMVLEEYHEQNGMSR